MTDYALLSSAAVLWLVACAVLYRRARRIPWLAGPTVTATLAMTGLTAIASTQVSASWALLPMLITNGVICGLHLLAAHRSLRFDESPPPAMVHASVFAASARSGRPPVRTI